MGPDLRSVDSPVEAEQGGFSGADLGGRFSAADKSAINAEGQHVRKNALVDNWTMMWRRLVHKLLRGYSTRPKLDNAGMTRAILRSDIGWQFSRRATLSSAICRSSLATSGLTGASLSGERFVRRGPVISEPSCSGARPRFDAGLQGRMYPSAALLERECFVHRPRPTRQPGVYPESGRWRRRAVDWLGPSDPGVDWVTLLEERIRREE